MAYLRAQSLPRVLGCVPPRRGRMIKALATIAFAFGLAGAAPVPEVKLWRLDCGAFDVTDRNYLSDAWDYAGGPISLTNSCYLIRHGDEYMLWDAGLGTELIGHDRVDSKTRESLKEGLPSQLARLGVKPEQITRMGISHFHWDHIGQAAAFPAAILMMGKKDWDLLSAVPPIPSTDPKRVEPWITGGARKEILTSDKDVYGDGSVVMLSTPGHSPSHYTLLVRLKNTGPVLLSGDLYYFSEQRARRVIPPYNASRAETLASFDRFEAIAKNLKATVIIQHDSADIAKLPAFPKAAD